MRSLCSLRVLMPRDSLVNRVRLGFRRGCGAWLRVTCSSAGNAFERRVPAPIAIAPDLVTLANRSYLPLSWAFRQFDLSTPLFHWLSLPRMSIRLQFLRLPKLVAMLGLSPGNGGFHQLGAIPASSATHSPSIGRNGIVAISRHLFPINWDKGCFGGHAKLR